MSNHHLRNKALSLKAKGLLSLMLSLPEDWDYTTRGLASICKEGVDSVCATVRELEVAGYIIRRRIRDKNGQMQMCIRDSRLPAHFAERPAGSVCQNHRQKAGFCQPVYGQILPCGTRHRAGIAH